MRLIALLVLLGALPAQQFHVSNQAGNRAFKGWVRRGIDWKPAAPSGTVQGHPFAVGRDLGSSARVLDVYVELEAGEAITIDFAKIDKPDATTDKPKLEFTAPNPSIAGVPFSLRSAKADGAGLDVHWRSRIGDLWIDLWCVLYPGQTWCTGELQLSANGPARAAVIPSGLVLRSTGAALVLGTSDGDEILPGGTTIAAGQGYSTLPVVFLFDEDDLQSAAAAGDLSIGAVGLQNVWPLGNPSWAPSRGTADQWISANYTRVRSNLLSWKADPLGILANAQSTGGEGDQVFVGAECSRGAESAGAELVNLMVAYGYARRPGKWHESNGDGLRIGEHDGLALFEGYPFIRGGSRDNLGLAELPNRIDTHGWAEWREHSFRNRLFVAYRLTGSLALQWQIDQFARQFLFECTVDPHFTTSNYTGALRGYGWECLTAWWLLDTVEDRALAAAVKSRWIERWRLLGAPRCAGEFWDIRRDDRLGPGMQWLAYQQAAAVMFIDMAGQACGIAEARDAAVRGGAAVLDHAFLRTTDRWVGYSYVPMDGDQPRRLPDGAHFGSGIESWMVGAAVVVARRKPGHLQAQEILKQHVIENNVNGQWIAPDVIRR